eukprot:3934529-Amphidinium_carterae.1
MVEPAKYTDSDFAGDSKGSQGGSRVPRGTWCSDCPCVLMLDSRVVSLSSAAQAVAERRVAAPTHTHHCFGRDQSKRWVGRCVQKPGSENPADKDAGEPPALALQAALSRAVHFSGQWSLPNVTSSGRIKN